LFIVNNAVVFKALLTQKSLSNHAAFFWSAWQNDMSNEGDLHGELFHPHAKLLILRINYWI